MNRIQHRAMVRLAAYGGGIVLAICYGAYKANPTYAIASVAAILGIGGLAWGIGRYKENQVRKMVAEVDALDRKS